MSKILYNEGRVVGYSAYELYVREALSKDPNTEPASEVEWLASSIASGSSMLLLINNDNISGPHYRDIPLPDNSKLCAANTILGSFFVGKGDSTSSQVWSTKVLDYGPLITNTSQNHPTGNHSNTNNILPRSVSKWSQSLRNQLKEYIKVIDGIVIQPGDWRYASFGISDLSPDLTKQPTLRLFLSDKISTPFYVLLTGFTIRSVINGVSGTDTSVNTDATWPENGGFLGPSVFPWSNKVIFSMPPAFVEYFMKNNYSRKLPANANEEYVKSATVIDMNQCDPSNYYLSNYSDSRVDMKVQCADTYGDSLSVLTVYQRNEALPPSLFGTKVDSTGNKYLCPIDVVSPGTIKMYTGEGGDDKAKSLESTTPNNVGLSRDGQTYVVYQQNQSGATVPVASTYTSPIYGTLITQDATDPYFIGQHNSGDPDNYYGFSAVLNRRITGKLSSKFREDYGIEYGSSKLQNILNSRTNILVNNKPSLTSINRSMYDQIDDAEKSEYYYIIKGPHKTGDLNKSTSQMSLWYIVPIKIEYSGDIEYGSMNYIDKMYIPFNLSLPWPGSSLVPGYSTYLDFLGSWWNSEKFDNTHVTVYEQIGDPDALIIDPNRLVPNGNGSRTWESIYRSTRLSDIFNRSQLNGLHATYEGKEVTHTKIHSQYHNCTLYELLQYAKVYNLSEPNFKLNSYQSGDKKYYGSLLSTYFVSNDKFFGDASTYHLTTSEPSDWSTNYKSYFTKVNSTKFVPVDTKQDWQPNRYYYADPDNDWAPIWRAISADMDFSTSINEENYNKTVTVPIPQEYIPSDGPQAVVNISGNVQTKSLAIADENGEIYDMSGTDSTIVPYGGKISWDILLNALASNASIDLVNMFEGDNIYIRIVDGKIVIGNLAPYLLGAVGYTSLYQKGRPDKYDSKGNEKCIQFKTIRFNGFTSWDANVPTISRLYNAGSYRNGYTLTAPYINLKVLPSKDTKLVDGVELPVTVQVQINSNIDVSASKSYDNSSHSYRLAMPVYGSKYCKDNGETAKGFYISYENPDDNDHKDNGNGETYNNTGFMFKHDRSSSDPRYDLSKIFGIAFYGDYAYLNNPKYKFMNTTGDSSGVWNMRSLRRHYSVNDDNGNRLANGWGHRYGDTTKIKDDRGSGSQIGASWNAVCRLDSFSRAKVNVTAATWNKNKDKYVVKSLDANNKPVYLPVGENDVYDANKEYYLAPIFAEGVSYADGHNTQFHDWDIWDNVRVDSGTNTVSYNPGELSDISYDSSKPNTGKGEGNYPGVSPSCSGGVVKQNVARYGKNIFSHHLNMSLTGVFYLDDSTSGGSNTKPDIAGTGSSPDDTVSDPNYDYDDRYDDTVNHFPSGEV